MESCFHHSHGTLRTHCHVLQILMHPPHSKHIMNHIFADMLREKWLKLLHELLDLHLGRGYLLLREVLMKRLNVLKASQGENKRLKGLGHNQMSCGFARLML